MENNYKERLIGAITVMTDKQAEALWDQLLLSMVPEVEPDEWDKEMIESIKNDPDCHTPATEEEVREVLGHA